MTAEWKENRMRHAMRLLGPSIVVSMAVALTGCMSMAFESDLVPGTTPAPAVGTARFYIAAVQGSTTGMSQRLAGMLFGTREDLNHAAVSARPNLFSDDFSAVPLYLKMDCSDAVFVPPSVFSPPWERGYWDARNYTVSITLTMEGDENLGLVAFKRWDVVRWDLVHTQQDIERSTKLTHAVCIEAVVKALGQCDAAKLAKLQAMCEDRKSRLQSLSLDGKPCWGWVGFIYSKPGASSGPRDAAVLSIFTQAPTYKTVPAADTVTVARRGEDGRWRPCNGYLRKSQTLTAATVLLENGLPGRVVLRPVEEPEIDDFIDLPVVAEKDRAESIRWSNGVLLQVKNRSIPRLVRERSGTELLDLTTRIQKVVLTLDEWATKCKDRAQQLVELGTGDPAPDREMAILCGQRIEVLRAILATITQEAARKKP